MSNETKTDGWFPVNLLDNLQEKIARLNRRAARLGLEPLELIVTDEREVMPVGEIQGWDGNTGLPCSHTIFHTCARVQVIGKAPKLHGWFFVARIEHTDNTNLLYSVPNETVPDEYWQAEAWCDHCQTTRRRNDTFVVRNEEGEYKQVGSSCIKDFLGHDIPLGFWRVFRDMADTDWLDKNCYPPTAREFGLEGILNLTAAVIHKFGWRSRQTAELECKEATSDTVSNYYFHPPTKEQNRVQVTDTDKEQAKAAHQWAAALTDEQTTGNNYLTNLRAIAQNGTVTDRSWGIGCSIIIAHKHEVERRLRAKLASQRQATCEWIGEVGQRIEMKVQCLLVKEMESQFGVTTLHKMVDEDGNEMVWFASGTHNNLNTNEWYKVKATVKNHDTFRDVRQTKINRVKVVEELGAV